MISILIPTMNRSEFITRALHYYSRVGFKGYVLIGDSSNSQHAAAIQQTIQTLSDKLQILYHYFPSPPYTNDALCLRELIGMAPTPYAVYAGDDDFVIPTTLEKCAHFLSQHPDYSAAHGIAVSVQLECSGAQGPLSRVNYMESHILESDSAMERWIGYIRHALSTQYYVHRTETWRQMYQDIPQVPSRYWGTEVLPCSLSAILGKIKELDELGCVFQINDQRYFGWDTHSMYSLMMKPEWSPSVENLGKIIIAALQQRENIGLKQIEQIFDQELWRHILIMLQSHYDSWYDEPLNIFAALKKRAPGLVRAVRLWRQLRSRRYQRISLKILLDPAHPFHADFMPIYQAIINHASED